MELADGQSHAGSERDARGLSQHVAHDGITEAAGYGEGGRSSHHWIEHHHELVAPHPGGGIACANVAADGVGYVDEQFVTGGVPQGVVDFLESVEIDEAQSNLAIIDLGPSQRIGEACLQHATVGKVGEFVMGGPMSQLLGQMLSIRGVS